MSRAGDSNIPEPATGYKRCKPVPRCGAPPHRPVSRRSLIDTPHPARYRKDHAKEDFARRMLNTRRCYAPPVNATTMTTLLTTALLCGGCVLPIPSRTTVRQGLSGRVVDSQTTKGVAGASVSSEFVSHGRRAGSLTATTDSAGRFRVPGDYRYHWGYLIGVALNYPLPYPGPGSPTLPASVVISHPDYRLLEYSFGTVSKRDLDYSTPQSEQNNIYRLTPKQ